MTQAPAQKRNVYKITNITKNLQQLVKGVHLEKTDLS